MIEGLATTRPLSRTPDVEIRKRFFFVTDAWTIMPWNGFKPSIISARKEPQRVVFLQVLNTNNKAKLKIARQGQKVPTYLSSASATTRKSFITSAPPRIHASSHPLQSRRNLSRRQANIRRGWRRFSPSARRGRWTSATTTASRWRTPTRESRSWNPPRPRRWAGRSPPGPPRC